MQVVFRSTFYAPSGYGNAARQIALAMDSVGVNLKLEPIGDRYPMLDTTTLNRLQALEHRPLEPNRILLTVTSGPEPNDREMFQKLITCVMWESSKAPAVMAAPCNLMDAMIVPNHLNKDAFRNAGVRIPIYTAPYGVDANVFTPSGPVERLGEPNDLFLFLSIFGWSERKGPDVLLRAFVQEFGPDEGVVLLIKTHGLSTDQFPQHLFDQVMAGMDTAHPPRIRLLTEAMSTERVAALIRGSDCFVLPSRGEGVGLPILESMACGIPAITTGWGGQMDFVTPDNGYLIPFALVPAQPLWWTDLYQPDQLWAEPDVGALQNIMRRAYRNRQEVRSKGAAARLTAEHWSWMRTAQAFIAAIEEIAGQPIHEGRKTT